MKILTVAVIGTGFWSTFQVAAWRELPGVDLIACYNRTRPRANTLAQQFSIPNVYDDIDQLLDRHAHELDFVDIITDVDTHPFFVARTGFSRYLPETDGSESRRSPANGRHLPTGQRTILYSRKFPLANAHPSAKSDA